MLQSCKGVGFCTIGLLAVLFVCSSAMADEIPAVLVVEAECEACEAGTCTDENCATKKCDNSHGETVSAVGEPVGEVAVQASSKGSDGDNDTAEAQLATPTHQQSKIIQVNLDDLEETKLNCFCVAPDGRILAGCGSSNEDGEIRVFNTDGDYVESWSVPVKVEAVNVRATDGVVFIAGNGHLVKLDESGNLLADKESPHASVSKEQAEKIRESVIQQLKQQAGMYERQIGIYEQQIEMTEEQIETLQDQLEAMNEEHDDDESDDETEGNSEESDEENNAAPNAAERKTIERQMTQWERRKEALERTCEVWKDRMENLGDEEPDDEEIDQAVEAQIARKLDVASISAVDDKVFVACSSAVGYGYSVWILDDQFADGKEIVNNLSGCCGQMDVQASESGIYVAENSRDRVVCFDFEGKKLRQWGHSAREGIRGFGSCCNPMNVAFGPNDTVYTAESGTGRIKQFSSDGELLQVVGSADLVPGCKKVSIGATSDGSRLYMLDITRDHIVMMDRVPAGERSEMLAAFATEQKEGGDTQVSKSIPSALGRIFFRMLENGN